MGGDHDRKVGCASFKSLIMDRNGPLFIVRPHTQNANRSLLGKNFVHDAVLNINAARVCAGKITD